MLTGWPSHGTKSCVFCCELERAVELQKSQSPRSMKLLDEYSEANKLSLCRSEVKGNQKWTPLFCKEMHPGHKPGRFAEVGPESWPPMATKSAVLFFLARVFHTGLRNLYKLQLCTKSDYITVIYVAASFWCTFFYHFFNDTHRYSKNID